MAELGTTGEWYNLTLVNTTFPAVDTTGSAAAAAAAEAEAEAGKPQWRRILDIIQIIVLSWGVVTNGVTAVCFRKQSAGLCTGALPLAFLHTPVSWNRRVLCNGDRFRVVVGPPSLPLPLGLKFSVLSPPPPPVLDLTIFCLEHTSQL